MDNTMDRAIKGLSTFKDRLSYYFDNAHPSGNPNIYLKLIQEEYDEFLYEEPNTADEFKELCDLIWVSIMYAIERGYPLEEGMAELMKEFESKLYDDDGNFCPTYREDGKLKKGKYFKKANFDKLFRKK